MKRFKMVGLIVVAVFALGAVMASGAQAGKFGTCVKKASGNYTEKTCETLASPAGSGKYEFVPNVKKIKFFSQGGESKLKGAAGEIVCKHGTDEGEIINGTENIDKFTFYECSLKPFELPCKNAEVEIEVGKGKTAKKEKVGVIITFTLKSKLVDHGEKGPGGKKEPAEKEVWNSMQNNGELHPSGLGEGPWLAAFECGPVPFAVSGSVASVIPAKYVSNPKLKSAKKPKPGKALKPTYEEVYSATGGEQGQVTTYFNPETSKVESGASIQEGTNLLGIEKAELEKGFEILDV